MRVITSAILASVALSGCISAYVPPAGAPLAKVRFQTSTPKNPLLFVRTQRAGELKCQQIGHFEAPEVSQVDMLGSVKEPRSDRIERVIQASAPFVVFFQEINAPIASSVGLVGVSCQVPIVFTPQAGGMYEVIHGSDNVAEQCSIRVNELVLGQSGEILHRPVAIQTVGKVTCL